MFILCTMLVYALKVFVDNFIFKVQRIFLQFFRHISRSFYRENCYFPVNILVHELLGEVLLMKYFVADFII